MNDAAQGKPTAVVEIMEEATVLSLGGDWTSDRLPEADALLETLPGGGTLAVTMSTVSAWDSRLLAFLLLVQRGAEAKSLDMKLEDAPEPVRELMRLALTVPRFDNPPTPRHSWLSPIRLRRALGDIGAGFLDSLEFLGDTLRALGITLLGRSAMRRSDFLDSCYRSGPDALGIIALTSTLVGMILAYLGAEQLRQFGAAIYVADLVTIGMLREMGALMTAVVMAGRTGASYAAELSSMQGNEEIDAIRTLGIPPMEFLVVPRVLALCITMPMLVIFADALGMVGGALVAGGMGVTPLQYLGQMQGALAPSHFFIGVGKALVFAVLIAIAGCRAGMQAGRSSEAVGSATTNAVVTSVVYLIIADAAINILCQQLGI